VNRKRLRSSALAILTLAGFAGSMSFIGCQRGMREVVVYTSGDQVFSEPIFREFERQSGTTVRAVFDTEETKSTGVLNRIIAEAQSPRTDVFWSGDPVRPFLLVKRGLVEQYVSASAGSISLWHCFRSWSSRFVSRPSAPTLPLHICCCAFWASSA
jgi:hypothetical protein